MILMIDDHWPDWMLAFSKFGSSKLSLSKRGLNEAIPSGRMMAVRASINSIWNMFSFAISVQSVFAHRRSHYPPPIYFCLHLFAMNGTACNTFHVQWMAIRNTQRHGEYHWIPSNTIDTRTCAKWTHTRRYRAWCRQTLGAQFSLDLKSILDFFSVCESAERCCQ